MDLALEIPLFLRLEAFGLSGKSIPLSQSDFTDIKGHIALLISC